MHGPGWHRMLQRCTCHKDACEPCEDVVHQECFCGQEKREVICGTAESFSASFSCQAPCNRMLACGEHNCDNTCHPGTCDTCRLLPTAVRYCACLKTALDELDVTSARERTSCLDPVPTCDKVCGKVLKCGPKGSLHTCPKPCHAGECGACPLQTDMKCGCRALHKLIACADIDEHTGSHEFRCDKRCSRKRDCGRHRCQNTCCTSEEHPCDLVCNKLLSCGLHRCEEPCHRGNCPRCWQVSFDELLCQCGVEVIMPPIPCGTRPPECRQPCSRQHACGHHGQHSCHSEERCPPCPQLTEKWCMGEHERRKNIPCHVSDVSCGMRCHKPLKSCPHKCPLVCHRGDCEADDKTCSQPCASIREQCGHPCSTPCHAGKPCPLTPCRTQLTLTCDCGNKTEKTACQPERGAALENVAASMLAMNRMDGQGIDISDLTKNRRKPRKLECDSECSIKERNKRLAEALDLNPDVSSKPGTTYTDYLKDYAKKHSTFVASVEKTLSELVRTALKSAHKSRSHSFSSMKSDQRKFVHELGEYYGCLTQSYDEEPQRNVVATAFRDKCFRPSHTLTTVAQRELHPKAPTPIPHRSSEQQIRSTVQASNQSTRVLGPWGASATPAAPGTAASGNSKTSTLTTLTKKTSSSSGSSSPRDVKAVTSPWSAGAAASAAAKSEAVIDYFEFTD